MLPHSARKTHCINTVKPFHTTTTSSLTTALPLRELNPNSILVIFPGRVEMKLPPTTSTPTALTIQITIGRNHSPLQAVWPKPNHTSPCHPEKETRDLLQPPDEVNPVHQCPPRVSTTPFAKPVTIKFSNRFTHRLTSSSDPTPAGSSLVEPDRLECPLRLSYNPTYEVYPSSFDLH